MTHTTEQLNNTFQLEPLLVEPGGGPTTQPSNRRWWLAAGVLAVAAGAIVYRVTATPAAPPYVTATVERGAIAKTISATGKLQPLTTVQVGSRVSGTISEIFVDYNSPVKKGQIIARIDPSEFQAQLSQAAASLAGANAGINSAQTSARAAEANIAAGRANVERARSVMNDAKVNLDRNKLLWQEKVIARQVLDTAQAAYDQAAAQVTQAEAQLKQVQSQAAASESQVAEARARAAQAQAAVRLSSINTSQTVIRSPIDGVVIARNVDVGQTVAASFSAPTLFLIAEDLTRMQVLADIDEADVGQLSNASKVRFTVDAFPGETFTAEVGQIRLAPQTVQNVVTYTAVLNVANPDLKLKPGMTANVTITVAERENVLTVPNSAFRFRPPTADNEKPAAAPRTGRNNNQRGAATIYRVANNKLEPVQVKTGLTDGMASEVTSGNLHEGDTIAIAAANGAAGKTPVNVNPFSPATRGGGRGMRGAR
ncbi:MAG: efflux RND transporter periplasmic adaptor subunit [Bryobacterales bacterium]|nr:efflux RND transporter periplasmic adaptor subunit [Bryobacterales bacterium]